MLLLPLGLHGYNSVAFDLGVRFWRFSADVNADAKPRPPEKLSCRVGFGKVQHDWFLSGELL